MLDAKEENVNTPLFHKLILNLKGLLSNFVFTNFKRKIIVSKKSAFGYYKFMFNDFYGIFSPLKKSYCPFFRLFFLAN